MSVERTYYCEGPSCGDVESDGPSRNVTTAQEPPYLPVGLIETRERLDGEDHLHHFCSWDCLMKYAAKQPVPERIDFDGLGE